MHIQNSVALVTGANRGLGKALVDELLRQGAKKVYAAARHPTPSPDPRSVPLRLDVTDPDQVAQAAEAASDATIVVNNAGSHSGARILDGDVAAVRADLETNFFGILSAQSLAHSRPSWPPMAVGHCSTSSPFGPGCPAATATARPRPRRGRRPTPCGWRCGPRAPW